MADVIVVGGGVAGLCGAMLLARDGHQVRLLERDPDPPPASGGGVGPLDPPGVNQFSMLHFFLPRFRELVETELPELAAALEAQRRAAHQSARRHARRDHRRATARRRTLHRAHRPPAVRRGDRRRAWRRPSRGSRSVRGAAVTRPAHRAVDGHAGVPHVVGVVTAPATSCAPISSSTPAAGARRSRSGWRRSVRVRRTRSARTAASSTTAATSAPPTARCPSPLGPPLQPYDSVSLLLLPADNGTWGIGIVASAVRPGDAGGSPPRRVGAGRGQLSARRPLVGRQADLRRRRDGQDRGPPPALRRRRRSRRHRRRRAGRLVGVHEPVGRPRRVDRAAPRRVPARHAPRGPRPTIRRSPSGGTRSPERSSSRCTATRSPSTATGWPRSTPRSPASRTRPTIRRGCFGQALGRAAIRDPELLRASISIASLLERGVDVMARPGIVEKVAALDRRSR